MSILNKSDDVMIEDNSTLDYFYIKEMRQITEFNARGNHYYLEFIIWEEMKSKLDGSISKHYTKAIKNWDGKESTKYDVLSSLTNELEDRRCS